MQHAGHASIEEGASMSQISIKKCSYCGTIMKKDEMDNILRHVDWQGFLFCTDCLPFCHKRDRDDD